MRGNDPLKSALANFTGSVDRQMLDQLIRTQHTHSTVKQVQKYSRYDPTILKWLFDEGQESLEDENKTQKLAISEFKNKKYDFRYFQMIEDRVRKNLARTV